MILALVMALSLVACSNGGTDKPDDNTETKKIKVGFITLHDENSTYDLNFINAAKEACQTLGLVENEDYFIKKNVPEGQECYNAAAELAEQGCNIIFADSFGHESFMIEAAKEFPNVQFCHSTGVRAHTEGLSNYHNAFASIYEGRYLATKSVVLSDLNTNVAADGTQAAIDEAMKKLESGELHVFDVSTFTVTGENVTADMKTDAEGHLTSYMADVDNDANMEHDTEVVHDGYFAESEKRSAPYFDIAIDGIVRLDVNFG